MSLALNPVSCHLPDCIQEKFEAGEFGGNTDGPWSVHYNETRNRYIFKKYTKRGSSMTQSPRGSSILGDFKVPVDDGVEGTSYFKILFF